MDKQSFGSFTARYLKIFGILGLIVGVVLFILTIAGLEIPVVIGTTSYEGMTSSLFLLIGSPIALLIIGFIVSIFAYSAKK
ncbi:hypothetical protein SAMN04488542_10717 [Fontibacillus panacisegetis]|uniref:Uncharacterized protein n=1 Tax=Fontibacillus panacisegetis TaxID=670482 RepID=A0A1G7J457_9BACL|nr:hypothetical protein [Fontibacillus panacisegetis]SDF19777.1 hypothetical protein SAMN04488542_10717 [Fontibacillus panacisegetis]